jgi:hypothetical protein
VGQEVNNQTAQQRTLNKLATLFEYPQAIANLIAQDDIEEAFRLCLVMQRHIDDMMPDYKYTLRKPAPKRKKKMRPKLPAPTRRDDKIEEGTDEYALCAMVADLLDLPEYDYSLLSVRIEKILGYGPNGTTLRKWKLFKGVPRTKGYPRAIRELWEQHYY